MIASTIRLETVGSTNSWALDWLRVASESELRQEVPRLIVAEKQTAGRGRQGKSWFAASDGLACTLVVSASPKLLSIAVGVAVAESLEMVAGPTTVQLKWPNDVWIAERKVAGILIESFADALNSEPMFVIGIGCNLRQFPTLHEEDTQATQPTSVLEATGRLVSTEQVLETLVPHLLEVIHDATNDPGDLLERFQSRHVLQGRPVRCLIRGQETTGICEGIDDDGSLVLQTPAGTQVCHSGEVHQLRRD
ncbi:biotin--[acetyl-CoA-carboxylase] ligase [Rhodopirellula sp. JC740]|uniref:biotin--[biotin carboxyl-carrier protein] ligase n=1 Tax=Rhodopirellula halodulae TaxID=2894198 RepID=A0ABS8NM40_9BACT|nr:biotin--[acetyl-CoA-carboxylase] ligase [Rhodopirellula sp. JC740]